MARRYTSAADRRNRDREIQRLAANRRVGHDHAYLILFGPFIGRGFGVLALIAGAAAVWHYADHRLIGFAAAAAGILMVTLYAANTIGASTVQAKQMALATGRRTRPLWWHGVGAAGIVLLALAYVALPL